MQIFSLTSGSELVVAPGSDTVLTQRRSDPVEVPGSPRDWHADVAQLVEHHLAKVRVAGSNPVVRSEARLCGILAAGQTRSCGGVAEWLRQGPAKPCTRVRFPSPPPFMASEQAGLHPLDRPRFCRRPRQGLRDVRDHALIRVLTEGLRRPEVAEMRMTDRPLDLLSQRVF